MDAVASTVVAVMLAVVGGMFVFGHLVILGCWLVRRLRIAGEPPDELAFEPAPPPASDPDPTIAPSRAAERERLIEQHDLARAVAEWAAATAELPALATDEAERGRWKGRAEELAAAAGRARQLLPGLPGSAEELAAIHRRAETQHHELLAAAAGRMAEYGRARRRRLLVLVAVLVVCGGLAALLLTLGTTR